MMNRPRTSSAVARDGDAARGQTGGNLLPTVLLRHELPDGTWHVDWMIATDAAGSGPLRTYRLPARLDGLAPGQSLPAQALETHRSIYLAFEGPLAAHRGRVTRVARGTAQLIDQSAASERLRLRWDRPAPAAVLEQDVELSGGDSGRWMIRCR